jgi:hypothetical protein
MTQTFIAPADPAGASLELRPGRRRRQGQPKTAGITLVVVCATTTMLMLDIAVVNTALTNIAADLHTGLGGGQWIADAPGPSKEQVPPRCSPCPFP